MITRSAAGLQYLLTDHLGSVVAVADGSGDLVSEQRYLPFGGVRPESANSFERRYNGAGVRHIQGQRSLT